MTKHYTAEWYAEHQAKVRKPMGPLPGVDIDKIHAKRKYRNEPTIDDEGIRHDSKREMKRWKELRLMLRSGKLLWLARQVEFMLPGGIIYRADFCYQEPLEKMVIEDVKGVRTPEYRLKKKLMRARGYEIQEI